MPPGLFTGVAPTSQEVEGDIQGQLKPEPGSAFALQRDPGFAPGLCLFEGQGLLSSGD